MMRIVVACSPMMLPISKSIITLEFLATSHNAMPHKQTPRLCTITLRGTTPSQANCDAFFSRFQMVPYTSNVRKPIPVVQPLWIAAHVIFHTTLGWQGECEIQSYKMAFCSS